MTDRASAEGLTPAEAAVFDEWFGPASDGMSEATRRAIRDGLYALRSSGPRYSPRCTCGHVQSSHRPDPDDVWVRDRCKTCGCATFDNRDDHRMQSHDD